MNLSHILAPIFACILAGFVFGRWRNWKPDLWVAAVCDLFMPALVFDALLTAGISLADMAVTSAAAAVVILLLTALCFIARPAFGAPVRVFALPVIFMNSGFLGIPLMDLAFGPEAVGHVVVYDQVQSLFMFTLGIWIAGERGLSAQGTFKLVIREPLVCAILAAGALKLAHVSVPESVLRPIHFLGSATPPLALVALGLRLAETPTRLVTDPRSLKNLALILILRFAGGIACGYAAVTLLSLTGLPRQVVLIASALPAAVFSYVLAERYGAEPDQAAAAVVISTAVSLPLLPFLLRLE
ncbi:MAG: hypothetical protein A3G34_00275 [Candidatus Lindowbacteria bacterium RIFCSPLOWO2_12_FULL_62_27]|nr:MAG: hypothetical protein A3G34_00275 [Candidatus Lindowbacteria bacterium RIFCSPLOWO2_12_FULL_62_27]OGH63384.1 MAG: hypothetical protein A3I06_08345 [Candidatus Lindowbacteria bacterium RIFCSPLOWO2_02_FULL_62_12]